MAFTTNEALLLDYSKLVIFAKYFISRVMLHRRLIEMSIKSMKMAFEKHFTPLFLFKRHNLNTFLGVKFNFLNSLRTRAFSREQAESDANFERQK